MFDEIDHLLLDRNSLLYREQGDLFKLLTPGMLTKLNELAKQKNVIFAIATNYYERIDRAIKRPGRIDERYLVLPPDLAQRERRLAREFEDQPLSDAELKAAAKESVFFTYAELEGLANHVKKRLASDGSPSVAAILKEAIHEASPMTTLEAYETRINPPSADGGGKCFQR